MKYRREFNQNTGWTGGQTALLLVLIFTLNIPALADNFSFSGNFLTDDEHRIFFISVSKSASITVKTFSYAGGTNAAGSSVPAGGFDPTLAIFDSSGTLIALNRDAGCDSVPADPITRFCWDSRLSFTVPPGLYQVVLTESENIPIGPTLNDSFLYENAGDFTADPISKVSDGFWDLSLAHRTGSFALDITGVDSAVTSLAPAVTSLVSAASQLSGQFAPNTILSYYDQALTEGTAVVTIGGQPAEILYSGSRQVNFVVPGAVVAGSGVPIKISRGSTLLLSTNIEIACVSPALFTATRQGTGQAAALNADFQVNSPTEPAARGTDIMLYGTGFGTALSPGPDGLSLLVSGVSAKVGGVSADVSYAGLAPGQTPGLQQINVHLPKDGPVGLAVPVQLTIAGVSTPSGTVIAIK